MKYESFATTKSSSLTKITDSAWENLIILQSSLKKKISFYRVKSTFSTNQCFFNYYFKMKNCVVTVLEPELFVCDNWKFKSGCDELLQDFHSTCHRPAASSHELVGIENHNLILVSVLALEFWHRDLARQQSLHLQISKQQSFPFRCFRSRLWSSSQWNCSVVFIRVLVRNGFGRQGTTLGPDMRLFSW